MSAKTGAVVDSTYSEKMRPPDKGKGSRTLRYRPDVDGLRAVAVILVILDHLGTRVTGGYIGVDVFFVISGYLISSVILSEMSSGAFSIAGFYERRVRRILPALLVMMFAVLLLAYRFLVPAETESLARSMLAALFSVSNFLFWRQAGYFDLPSTLKPLLHTWSLAVEEQFYILFPLFLVAIRRWSSKRLQTAIWTVTGLSFIGAVLWVQRDATAAFFFAPLRAWELLIGTILSQHYLRCPQGRTQRNIASLAGFLLILLPALIYTSETPFPGFAALPPCLGAALIIAAGETGPSLVGDLLASRPFVFVGLISYSLYLWHWPLLVFQKTSFLLVKSPPGSKETKAVVFLASLIAGTLSWWFVERPFRKGYFRPGRRTLFVVNGIGIAAIAVACILMISSQGMAFRFTDNAVRVSRYMDFDPSHTYRERVCFLDPNEKFSDFQRDTCLQDDKARQHYLLLGDSHAAQLYTALAGVFPEINLSQATVAQCKPFMDEPKDVRAGCSEMSRYIFSDYLVHHPVDTVLLGGRWQPRDLPELERTISWIRQHGMRVVVFGPLIEYDLSQPRVIAASLRENDPDAIERHRNTEPQSLDSILAHTLSQEPGVRYISIYDDLCGATKSGVLPDAAVGCPVYAQAGVPLLFDTDHLTPAGSVLYAKAMRERHQLP